MEEVVTQCWRRERGVRGEGTVTDAPLRGGLRAAALAPQVGQSLRGGEAHEAPRPSWPEDSVGGRVGPGRDQEDRLR